MKLCNLIFNQICIAAISVLVCFIARADGAKQSVDKVNNGKNVKNIEKLLCDGTASEVKSWVKNGGNPNKILPSGQTLLTFVSEEPSCTKNAEKVVDILIKYGADVNLKDINGTPPIVAASSNNKHYLIKKFLQKNLDVNAVNALGYNAILVTSKSGRKRTLYNVKFLIEIGVDPSFVAPNGHTALLWITKDKYPEVYKLIVSAIEKRKNKD